MKPTKAEGLASLPVKFRSTTHSRFSVKLASAFGALTLLSGCAGVTPDLGSILGSSDPQVNQPAPTPSPTPTLTPTPEPETPAGSAALQGVYAGPSVESFGLLSGDSAGALRSFRESCGALLRRTDTSGLTTNRDWEPACSAAENWPASNGRGFFEEHFEVVRIGNGQTFVTGYYEPEIRGSRTRRAGYETPIYAMPDDLKRDWHTGIPASERKGRAPLGRRAANGDFVPYYERAEIEQGALAGRGLELGWAADPVELFFLQIQGSGRVRTPEGEVIRIGYAGQNGREYTGVGSVMRERELFGTEAGKYAASMQGIMAYIRENPQDGADLMRLNKSWIFFHELTGDGPLGALSVPVRRESSVATDPKYVPLGAPVFLRTDREETRGLWIAQDTGGAIKGPNRFDSFWGAGEDARRIAGGMSARGEAWLFVPKGTLARLNSQ